MPPRDRFKLLALRPHCDVPNSPVGCEIRETQLSFNPRYEALSYAWGEQINLTSVYIAGVPQQVTQSLNAALVRLRLPNKVRLLWVDQLCINQDNQNEKAEQVQLMRLIYSKATQCIVWLGEIPSSLRPVHVTAAVDFIKYMAAVSKAEDQASVQVPESLRERNCVHAALHALRHFTHEDNIWWSRLWTLQEIVLARSVSMIWGPHLISWNDILLAQISMAKGSQVRAISGRGPQNFPSITSLIAHVAWIDGQRKQLHRPNVGPLRTVYRWRWRDATDKRDKIYGLLGLITPGSLPITQECDYSISAANLFTVATLELIVNENSLCPLTLCSRLERERATPHIPSWAFDLAHAPRWHTNWLPLHGYYIYDACGGNKLDLGFIQSLAAARSKDLKLGGWFVDTVKVIGTAALIEETRHGRTFTSSTIQQTVQQWRLVAEQNCSTSNHGKPIEDRKLGELDDVFARLLLGDWVRDHQQEPLRPATEADLRNVSLFSSGETHYSDDDVLHTIIRVVPNQVFFVTHKGLIGIGNMDAVPGDEIWVLEGGNYPFILRSRAEAENKWFVGSCYVQGLMKGELFTGEEVQERQNITIS